MNVLVTGHHGYIGSVLSQILQIAGHSVTGLDTFYFSGCTFGEDTGVIPELRMDVRDVTPDQLMGFDAIIHLAALSNDPMGELNATWTEDINTLASIRLAKAAKFAGVGRFLFSSSCSIYGASDDKMVNEEAPLRPLSNYSTSKVCTEEALLDLADDNFSPVLLRNATVYGVSPRLRVDLVLNNLVGWAYTTGKIVIMSDGLSWRPLIHVKDVSHAFLTLLEAPQVIVHRQVFNIGDSSQNYQVKDLARLVGEVMPKSQISYTRNNKPDPRNYRVDFSKLHRCFPGFQIKWNARKGIQELYQAYRKVGFSDADFHGSKYTRLQWLTELISTDKLDESLRWKSS